MEKFNDAFCYTGMFQYVSFMGWFFICSATFMNDTNTLSQLWYFEYKLI